MAWYNEAFFYHIYPLGAFTKEKNNCLDKEVVYSLDKVYELIGHFKDLGVNAVFFGPIFQSESHGYDTIDYFKIDRRLGSNESFKNIVKTLHDNNIKVIVDGVFHHSGRNYFAFNDLLQYKHDSRFKDWYYGVDFSHSNHYNDPFSYHGWAGNINLVKYNLHNEQVVSHLLDAVNFWIDEFDIDGIRLDAADELDHSFLTRLSAFTKSKKSDFFLVGEVVHGNYSQWAMDGKLHSTTNYECYKGLYSSLNDMNYFEIAYALNRQFGDHGIYKNIPLYNFTDNHDVDRVASTLKKKEHLYPLYGLLFTMPGAPSIYYGSEWGMTGKRTHNSDGQLRPPMEEIIPGDLELNLYPAIKQFASIRANSIALRYGVYRQLSVSPDTFAFQRSLNGKSVIVALNSASEKRELDISSYTKGRYRDILNNEEVEMSNIEIPSCWLRIIEV